MAKKIQTPLTEEVARSLKMGEEVYITGVILTGRDAAHKRLVEALDKDGKTPIDLEGQIIYYVGPSPAKPGKAVGSAGPTTSYRMGKGPRNQGVKDAMKEKGCVYFAATGGAAALIARAIKKSTPALYEELGPEAVNKYEVVDFPVVVATDCAGNDLYEEGPKKYRKV